MESNDPRLDMIESTDVKRKKFPSFSPLHKATLCGDLEKVKELIKEGDNPLDPDLNDDTILHHAASLGELEILKYLVEELGCNAATRGWKGTTPLHAAAQAKQFPIVKYLIEDCGSDPTATDDNNQYPLNYGYRFGKSEFVDYFIEAMATYMKKEEDIYPEMKLGTLSDEIKRTYLPASPGDNVKKEDPVVFSPDFMQSTQASCLYNACSMGNLEMIQQILCFLNNDLKYIQFTFCSACITGQLSVAKFLSSKFNPNSLSLCCNINPLHLAVHHDHISIVRFLVKTLRWKPENCLDYEGNHPIYPAIHKGNLEMIKLFIDNLVVTHQEEMITPTLHCMLLELLVTSQ